MNVRAVACALAVAALIAGCSSSSSPGSSSTLPASTPAGSSSGPFANVYGADAATLASRIPHCAGAHVQDTGNGAATGMAGKAGCTLSGHLVVIYTWVDAASQSSAESIVAESLAFHATGRGWTQVLGDDATAGAQQTIATAVAASLGGTVDGS